MPSTCWIKKIRPNHQAVFRLFCLPFAGGGANFYAPWADVLPSGIDICPIQLPGREIRLHEPSATCMSSLVQTLASELMPFFDLPFAFFGHSMGALIAFEMARELRRRAAPLPWHLFLSGRVAPHVRQRQQAMHTMNDDDFIRELRRHDGIPEAILKEEELMAFFLPIMRADFTLVEMYLYHEEAPLACPMTIYGGLEDKTVNWKILHAWQQLTTRAFSLCLLPGGHFFLQKNRPDFINALARELAKLVEEEQATSHA